MDAFYSPSAAMHCTERDLNAPFCPAESVSDQMYDKRYRKDPVFSQTEWSIQDMSGVLDQIVFSAAYPDS
jgi:hypothetical protein